jgi:hypothetical protein
MSDTIATINMGGVGSDGGVGGDGGDGGDGGNAGMAPDSQGGLGDDSVHSHEVQIDSVKVQTDSMKVKLVPQGEPFSPATMNQAEAGQFQRVLPQSIYSAFILLWLNADTRCLAFFGSAACTLLPLVVTVGAQTVLSYYLLLAVRDVDGDLAPDCAGTPFLLQAVALTAFVALIVQEAAQVLDMHLWLQMFKSADVHEMMKLQKYKEHIDVPEEVRGKNQPASIESIVHQPTTGITRGSRKLLYLLVLLPNLAITGLVMAAGSGAVLRSSNRFDLVLNTVAAIFVVELDDIFYFLLLPHSTRSLIEDMPPLNRSVEQSGWANSCIVGFWPWFLAGLIVFLDWPLYQAWCT